MRNFQNTALLLLASYVLLSCNSQSQNGSIQPAHLTKQEVNNGYKWTEHIKNAPFPKNYNFLETYMRLCYTTHIDKIRRK